MGNWVCRCGNECYENFCPKCGSKRPEHSNNTDIESVNKTLCECETKKANVILCITCGAKIEVNSDNAKDIECSKCGFKKNFFDSDYLNSSIPTKSRLNIESLSELKTGDEFVYGRFTSRSHIKWKVIDSQPGKIEAICQAGWNAFLDRQPYNEELVPTKWNTCSLRRFLNEDFLDNVFTEEERCRIISTEVPCEKNRSFGTSGGDSTVDKVFILSASEASRLIPDDYSKKRKWWLRTPGYTDYSVCFFSNEVDYIGELVNIKEGPLPYPCARPVIWVDTSGIPQYTREVTKEDKSDYKKGNEIEYGFDPHRGPIKWEILDIRDDCALIISKEIFRERFFDTKPEDDHDYIPLWENSNIKKWLNGVFFDYYFTEEEKQRVVVTNNQNNNVKKYDDSIVEAHATNDKVFVLSSEEAEVYFTEDDKRCCEGCEWMLRNTDSVGPLTVSYKGEIGKYSYPVDSYIGVRPVMWIKCCF